MFKRAHYDHGRFQGIFCQLRKCWEQSKNRHLKPEIDQMHITPSPTTPLKLGRCCVCNTFIQLLKKEQWLPKLERAISAVLSSCPVCYRYRFCLVITKCAHQNW
ncbi:hypothetical protein FKM82_008829 [Ascaphus truei]